MSVFVVADTEYGAVRGVKKLSCLGTCFNAFLGIPFATPPVGELRFKDPLAPSAWKNVYDATEEKSSSFGENFYLKRIVGSEDCLFLNIFSKDLQPKTLQPVLLYIHGGGFNAGSSTTDLLSPDYLLMANVVVVTINYRLGALGFLSLKDKELNVPGNAALKDQLMAMKFVKKNIQNFGGDPNNVTLFGQSAGGSCVSWHCVSEQSKGFFQKAIMMAGCVLNKFSLIPQKDWAHRLANKLGYDGSENERDVLEFLQKVDPVGIVGVQDNLLLPEEKGKISMAFAPHIEHYETENSFIVEHPIDLARKAWSNDIDILIGGTSNEGLMFLEYIRQAPVLIKRLTLESMVPSELDLSGDDPLRMRFAEKLRMAYYPFGTDPTVDEMGFCEMKADQSFWHGMHRLIRCRRRSEGKGKTFLYRFAVDSPTQNHYRNVRLGLGVKGVCHSDELSYLFKNKYIENPKSDSVEFQAIQRFVSLFTSFATTGNPNDNIINVDMENVQWHPIESLEPPFMCLNIDKSLTFQTFPGSERLKLWDDLYEETKTPLC